MIFGLVMSAGEIPVKSLGTLPAFGRTGNLYVGFPCSLKLKVNLFNKLICQ